MAIRIRGHFHRGGPERTEFTTALALKLAEVIEDNRDMLIAEPKAVRALERTLEGLFAPAGEERRPRREGKVGE